jgi:uncharacterized protein
VPSKSRKAPKSSDALFLDANILMYAIGAEHPLREPCRRALERAVSSGIFLATDSEVLQEILYRYFAIRRPEIARTAYSAAVRLCAEILPVTETHTARALELLLQRPAFPPRDAIHVAAMESAGIRRILSTDAHFDVVRQVERIAPGRFAGIE